MSKILSSLLPDSFKNRFLVLFILFAVVTGLVSTAIQYFYNNIVYRSYAAETIVNIHKSVEERLRDAILYDDIYSLFSLAENITKSVSLVENVFITDPAGSYITDSLVSKRLPESFDPDAESYDLKLQNGKKIGRVVYVIDMDEIHKTILTHSLTGLFMIIPVILIFVFLCIRLILFLTKPLNSISEKLQNTDISRLPIEFDLPAYASVEVNNLADAFTSLSEELDRNVKMNIEQEKNLAKEERLAAIGSMSAGLAHELRNPAMSLQMLMHSISNSGNTLDGKDLEVMSREVGRITSTVNEFLQVAKTIDIQPEQTSSEKLKNMVGGHVKMVMKDRISVVFSGEKIDFRSDEILIFNTLVNMINNSYEAGATKAHINFSREGAVVIITVRDNGTGISDVHRDKIFRPFFTTKKSGTGLGMSMCEKMISALGGSITLADGNGVGAEFIINIKDPT
jgi:signal transduction histidine kinase